MIDVSNWPAVPQAQRPKPLFVNTTLSPDEEKTLADLGWCVQDVRLLPNTSVTERQALVLAWFEGLRNGTITLARGLLEVLEAESKACGLTNVKQPIEKPKELADETLEAILDIKNKRPTRNNKDKTKS